MNIFPSVHSLWLRTSLCLLFCLLVSTARADGAVDPAKSVVEKLYRDYAWVVLIDNSGLVNLVDQSEAELSKYFTASLSNLISKDHKCAEATQDVCNLDFDPIYDSQDPSGTHQLRIGQMNHASEVMVTFLPRWSSPNMTELRFKMTDTSTGWRIDDIYYRDHESLRSILQQKGH
jgi:Protein of unknown function (DUF3828)